VEGTIRFRGALGEGEGEEERRETNLLGDEIPKTLKP
jgi:hypothetical protein